MNQPQLNAPELEQTLRDVEGPESLVLQFMGSQHGATTLSDRTNKTPENFIDVNSQLFGYKPAFNVNP